MGEARTSNPMKKKRSGGRLSRPDVALQYGAICLRFSPESDRAIEVLLITSRDTGRWVIPKGWGIAKKTSSEVAKQEAWEEAGIRGRVWKKSIGSFEYRKALQGGKTVPAQVCVHLILVSRVDQRYPEQGERTLRWCSPLEAAKLVDEPELKVLFTKVSNEVAKLLRRAFKQSERGPATADTVP
jgi:8-oxo-dGTP pyrophosphatase MutT (NUDIX family)